MNIPTPFLVVKINGENGLFSLNSYKKGQTVAYESEDYIIVPRKKSKPYAIQIDSDKFLDHPTENYLDYVNHSCDPNMEYDTKKFCFVAIMNIPALSHLTYDYETTEEDLRENSFECKCGYHNCRKTIKGNKK